VSTNIPINMQQRFERRKPAILSRKIPTLLASADLLS
jgi:hypothetical protein